MSCILITEPGVEPVDKDEARAQLVLESGQDDIQLEAMITAARRHVEQVTGKRLVRQKWRLYRRGFSSDLRIRPGPVREIESITYIDLDGVEQTVASSIYELDIAGQRLLRSYNQTWPVPRAQENNVWIDFWSGYYDESTSPVGDPADKIPGDLKAAILMLVAHLYEHRESKSEFALHDNATFMALVAPHRDF